MTTSKTVESPESRSSAGTACSPTVEQIRELATKIGTELDCTIDGRSGNSAAHQRMYEIYKEYPGGGFAESAIIARATWVEEELLRLFGL